MQACEGAGAGGFVPSGPGPLAQGVISAARETQRNGEEEDGRRKSAPDEACDLQLPLPATGESAAPAAHVSTGSTDQQLDTASEGGHLIEQSVCAGMLETELKDLSYTLFVGCCSAYCSEQLADDVRRQLEVPSSVYHQTVYPLEACSAYSHA